MLILSYFTWKCIILRGISTLFQLVYRKGLCCTTSKQENVINNQIRNETRMGGNITDVVRTCKEDDKKRMNQKYIKWIPQRIWKEDAHGGAGVVKKGKPINNFVCGLVSSC